MRTGPSRFAISLGLMMPCERKSVEPIAAITAPKRTAAQHQSLLVAHRDYWLAASRPEEWLLIEWPDGEKEPIKYWLSTLPKDVAFRQLVDIAKLRWRIERDYQELIPIIHQSELTM